MKVLLDCVTLMFFTDCLGLLVTTPEHFVS